MTSLVGEYTKICWGVHQNLLGSTLFFAGGYTKTCQGVHPPLRGSTLSLVGEYTTVIWVVFLSFAGVSV